MESVLVGFFAGLVIVLYRYVIEKALDISRAIYLLQHTSLWLIPLWVLILIIGGYIVGWIIEKEPMSSGSGIPQVEGVLLRKLSMRWWSVLLAKFSAGVISIGAGLSLGREGPSIQMGAAIGQGFSRIFKHIKLEEKFLMTSGAAQAWPPHLMRRFPESSSHWRKFIKLFAHRDDLCTGRVHHG